MVPPLAILPILFIVFGLGELSKVMLIVIGIIVAVWWGNRRYVQRGGTPSTITDIAIWAVPFGIVGGRLYHVITDREQQQEQRRKDIEAVFDQLGKTAARHEGVRIDRDRHVIDFGDRARFAFNKSDRKSVV